jgi:tetratricopeptide (TPR) repeat protein
MRFVSAAALCLCACTSRPPLPELPALDLARFQPSVRAEVERAFDEARRAPEDARANGRLGMVLHAHDQFGAARVMYQRARALDAKAFEWPYYAALAESAAGNREEALAALEEALAIDPSYAPARLRRSEILFDLGRLDESGRAAQDLAREYPEMAAAWYGVGRVKAAKGETAEAIAALQRACQLYPQFGAAQYALAQTLNKAGRKAEAEPHLAAYGRFKTNAPPSNDRWTGELQALNRGSAFLLRLASDAEQQGNWAAALKYTEQALAEDPKSAQAHVNLVSLYGRAGQAEKALKHYRTAVELNPNLADAHYNYGVILFQLGKRAEAAKAFERALAANPYHAQAHNNLAFVLEAVGRTAEAAAHYRKAIENDPNYRLAHFHLGRVLANQRNYPEAIAHLEKTLSPEDASTPGYMYALGAVYGRSGDRGRAADLMQRARAKAEAAGQAQLVASIDRDLRTLGVR